jgi:hypothetical protein
MNYSAWLWGIVNWLSLPVVVAVAGILASRKLHREFPFFWALLVATGIVGVARFIAQFRTPWTYFYVYWISNLALDALNLLAVYELFGLRLFTRFYKVRFYRYLFAGVAAVIALGSWFTAMVSANKYKAFIVQDRVFDFVVVALLAFFLCLMLVMGREWRRYDFAIAFGLVIGNAGSLIASAMWLRSQQHGILGQLEPVVSDVASLIWLCGFWSNKAVVEHRAAPQLDTEMVHQARKWESILKAWLTMRNRAP